MKVLVFGATGRTGASVVEYALAAGHDVTAFVRNATKMVQTHERLTVVEGDISRWETVTAAMHGGFDAVVNTIGSDPFAKQSTIVSDSVRAIMGAMNEAQTMRYLGITGVAEMPKRGAGPLMAAIIRRSPIRATVHDHDAAFALVAASGLDWTLAGCPYIKDGAHTGIYTLAPRYPGGFKIISPQDVADFFVHELTAHWHSRQVVGIWY